MRVAFALLVLPISCMVEESVESRTPGLRAAYIAAVQKDAYRFDGLETDNAIQKFRASFTPQGLRIDHARWTFELAVTAIGCDKDPARVEPEVVDHQVVYRRGPTVEWYRSGPLGIEQGFELSAPPGCTPELSMRSNLRPELDETNASILFGGVVRYSDLYVTDADKRQLPARLGVAGDRIFIRFDDRGAKYPVRIDPLVWTEQKQLISSDRATGDAFGAAVALSVDTAVIGAAFQSDFGPGSGAAYVFTRTGTVWTEQAKLLASDGATDDNFGLAVAVNAATAVIGAPFHDQSGENAGAAYVFTRTGTVWTEQAKLLAGDAAPFSGFGRNVEVDADRAVIGAPEHNTLQGMAYVFVRAAGTWSEEQRLEPSALGTTDAYGFDVALRGDTAAVSNNRNLIFLFRRSASVWTEENRISGVALGDSFGAALALDSDTLVIGDREDATNGMNAGAAHVYLRTAGVWSLEQTLTPVDARAGQRFGAAVSVSGQWAAIGADGDDELGAGAGAAYLFQRSGSSWTQAQKLLASNGGPQGSFGRSITVAGAYVIAGAGLNEGSAYTFAFGLALGDPCAINADCPLGFCVDGVCCDNACGGGDGDDCQSCLGGRCGPSAADTECREAAGDCDLAERCDGVRVECPNDQLAELGTECRAANGLCDAAELCIGTADCPIDRFTPNGRMCRPALDVCDRAESCSGNAPNCPNNQYAPAGTTCGPSAGVCDIAETCTGASSVCPENRFLPVGTECRPVSGACDVAESCNGGQAACPADQVMSVGTVCRASSDTCDAVETCDGTASSCPSDQSIADCPPPPPPEEGCSCNASKRASSALFFLLLLPLARRSRSR